MKLLHTDHTFHYKGVIKLKKNKIILAIGLITVLSVVSIYGYSHSIKAEASTDTKKTATSNQLMKDENLNDNLEIINDKEKMKDTLNIKYKEPSYVYKNMTEIKTEGEKKTSSINDFEVITKLYKSEDGKEIRIQQAQDTGKPEDLLSTCRKISIKGIDAWVYGESQKDDYSQILLWYNDIYYNISGYIGVTELTNIASSYIK